MIYVGSSNPVFVSKKDSQCFWLDVSVNHLSLSVDSNSENDEVPDDSFFELIMKCQGTRIDEQRTFLPHFDLGSPQSELHLGDSQL